MDVNKSKLVEIINSENKRQPLTDCDIAEKYGCERSYITQLRKSVGIPDSRIRLRNQIIKKIEQLSKNEKNIDNKKILAILEKDYKTLSPYLIKKVLNEINSQYKTEKTENKLNLSEDDDVFSSLIGAEGSLNNSIKLVKSAILYPPDGLHTLITGESGVGKSLLAKKMFQYGRKINKFGADAEIVSFNCADYTDNPQLLLSQLFGVRKGAYTGADADRAGLIDRANGGVLFLDEIHRMPAKGQEILFNVIDSGKYRRLGETDDYREVKVLIIGATTEEPEKCLLDTFLRRIPMVLKIPSLRERPLKERIILIRSFLNNQAKRINKSIRISKQACYALLLYEPIGNVGKLFNDIQVCLARSYLNSLSKGMEEMFIDIDLLPNEIQRGLLKTKIYREKLAKLLPNEGVIITTAGDNEIFLAEKEYGSEQNDNIYTFIDEKYHRLAQYKLDSEEINKIVGEEIETRIKSVLAGNKLPIDKFNITKIIGSNMTNILDKALEFTKELFDSYDSQFYYSVALHVSEAIKRLREGKEILNPKLAEIKTRYAKEYEVACKIVNFISNEKNVVFPEAEAGFIALYLRSFLDQKKDNPLIGILVITHGKTAGSLTETAQKLIGLGNVISLEMPLDENPEKVLSKAVEMVELLDQGKGVLIMVDMGSLVTFGPLIAESTGLPVRSLDRVELCILLEAIRLTRRMDISLDELYCELKKLQSDRGIDREGINKKSKKPVIITTCVTGLGTCIYLKEMLDRVLQNCKFTIIALGVIGKEEFIKKIRKIQENHDILAVVGTVNPHINNLPYISMQEVIDGKVTARIKQISESRSVGRDKNMKIDRRLLYVKKDFSNKKDVIKYLCEKMFNYGYITKQYINKAFEREKMGPTCMLDATDTGIAIVHSHDTGEIINNGLSVLTLEKPIKWWKIDVDVVFLFAVKSDFLSDLEMFNRNILNDADVMTSIRSCNKKAELEKLLLQMKK